MDMTCKSCFLSAWQVKCARVLYYVKIQRISICNNFDTASLKFILNRETEAFGVNVGTYTNIDFLDSWENAIATNKDVFLIFFYNNTATAARLFSMGHSVADSLICTMS